MKVHLWLNNGKDLLIIKYLLLIAFLERMVFIAQAPALSHPFHLHGQEFYVMDMQVPPQNPNGTLNVPYIIQLDRDGKLKRNFNRPPAKDTLAVPRSGYIIIRFHATNPGTIFFSFS